MNNKGFLVYGKHARIFVTKARLDKITTKTKGIKVYNDDQRPVIRQGQITTSRLQAYLGKPLF